VSTQTGAPDLVQSRITRPASWVRDLPIWTKLGLIMIVPTLATIVVGTAALLGQVQQASLVERARSLTVLAGDASGVAHQLQNERALGVQVLQTSKPADLAAAYKKQAAAGTDAAILKYHTDRITIADVPDNLQVVLDGIEVKLADLQALRAQVTTPGAVALTVAESRYQVLISDLLSIRDLSAQLTGDPTLTDRMRAASEIARTKEFLSQERIVVLEALASNNFSDAARREYIGTLEGQAQALDTFTTVAAPSQKQLFDAGVATNEQRDASQFEGKLDTLKSGADPASVVPLAAWDKAMMARGEQMNAVEVKLNGQALQSAVDLGTRVQRQVLVETGLLLVTLLLGVLFAWLVARSMARALRDLRQGALAVAQYGLPQAVARLRDPALSTHSSPAGVAMQIAEPLPVRSRDEFGQVTEAFNAVHLEAVRTAAEQAALRSSVATMFVNLARRSQILVDRLIGHLDRLERGEQDPDRLGELFQLDHLATRMRRNDENLLVLAGADSTRIQREPAALMDVLRAAQSEVEHYTRIEFSGIDHDIEIAAHAVNDLVHLVAELFDNATAFSPPDTSILVEAHRQGERAVLQVADRGIGMSPDQYGELNERLATPPMVDVAVSRMMGLVVVARLAARHGVRVELQPAHGRGTVATVFLPSGVMVPRALAGRTHAPAGFPAARGTESATPIAPMRPGPGGFPPPLALESGPTGGAWNRGEPPRGPGFAPPPAPFGAPPVPAGYGGGPGGLGAALASGGYGAQQGPPYGNGNGRPTPAWYDFTGASQAPAGGPPPGFNPGRGVPPTNEGPLPHRRPGQWGEPEDGPAIPRQQPSQDSFGGAPGGPGGWPGTGGPSVSNFPPPPTFGGPAQTRPPAWPPVAEPGEEGLRGISASLDMTSELPRTRGGAADPRAADGRFRPSSAEPPNPPTRYSDDMTLEMPIFRELESAWFNPTPHPVEAYPGGSAPSSGAGWSGAAAPPSGAGWPGGPTADTGWDTAMAGSARATTGGAYRSERTTGSDGVRGAGDRVSWRTVADDGWTAAQAALDPQDGGTTDMGLPRRVPMAQLVPGSVEHGAAASTQHRETTTPAGPDRRTPDSVRGLLSAYHRGVQRGRGVLGADENDTPQTRGKEQEA
jgi:signal transduction histidine kinase